MNAETQGGLLILTGGIVGRMALGSTYLLYVREGMRPWLLASAAVLLLLGSQRVWSSLRPTPAQPVHHGGDRHQGGEHRGEVEGVHAPRVAWLLVVPVLAVALIAPTPLGSYTADRQSSTVAVVPPPDPFPPLARDGDQPVALPVIEFVRRALYDDKRSLDGVPVRLTGMVTPAAKGGSEDFRLTRFMIACCAADAEAIQIAVHTTAGTIPPNDSWVQIVGRWRPPPPGTTPDDIQAPPLDLLQLQTVPQPDNPYED